MMWKNAAAAFLLLSFTVCIAFQGLNAPKSQGRMIFRPKMSEQSPEDDSDTSSRRDFLIKGAAGAGSLAVGKYFIDGPAYTGTPNLSDKSIVITGGNTGLGKESAVRLAKLGAEVCIACRNPEKAAKAVEDIKLRSKSDKVTSVTLDLASKASIRQCAEKLKAQFPKIDILQNNAGVMALPERQTTQDGFEYQFGVNHLGHFYLTKLLMESILKSPKPRIVNLSSYAHEIPPGVVNFDDIMAEKEYKPWIVYGQSKLANILFTKELQRRLDEKTDKVTVMCCHPGIVRTELARYLDIPPYLFPLLLPAVYFTKSVEMGAQTQTFLCAEPSLEKVGKGKYYDNCAEQKVAPPALDVEAAKKLWEVSEDYIGGKFVV